MSKHNITVTIVQDDIYDRINVSSDINVLASAINKDPKKKKTKCKCKTWKDEHGKTHQAPAGKGDLKKHQQDIFADVNAMIHYAVSNNDAAGKIEYDIIREPA